MALVIVLDPRQPFGMDEGTENRLHVELGHIFTDHFAFPDRWANECSREILEKYSAEKVIIRCLELFKLPKYQLSPDFQTIYRAFVTIVAFLQFSKQTFDIGLYGATFAPIILRTYWQLYPRGDAEWQLYHICPNTMLFLAR